MISRLPSASRPEFPVLYSVLLLPAHEVVAQGLTQREAEAWVRTYNDALGGSPSQAILAEEAAGGLRPAA